MKHAFFPAILCLAALTSATLPAAEPAKDAANPAALSPKELQLLVRENNAKLNNLRRVLEGVCHWHNDKKRRDTEFVLHLGQLGILVIIVCQRIKVLFFKYLLDV